MDDLERRAEVLKCAIEMAKYLVDFPPALDVIGACISHANAYIRQGTWQGTQIDDYLTQVLPEPTPEMPRDISGFTAINN